MSSTDTAPTRDETLRVRVAKALPCGHHGPTNRPCATCAVFADTPGDEEW